MSDPERQRWSVQLQNIILAICPDRKNSNRKEDLLTLLAHLGFSLFLTKLKLKWLNLFCCKIREHLHLSHQRRQL